MSATQGPAAAPESGPISRMVSAEIAGIQATLESVRAAWDARNLLNAARSLAWLSTQLERHMRWEEESLFEELELRATLPGLRRVRAHHLGHEALARQVAALGELLARHQGAGDAPELAIETALGALERAILDHTVRELDEVCCPLDKALEPAMVETIRTELFERGRVY